MDLLDCSVLSSVVMAKPEESAAADEDDFLSTTTDETLEIREDDHLSSQDESESETEETPVVYNPTPKRTYQCEAHIVEALDDAFAEFSYKKYVYNEEDYEDEAKFSDPDEERCFKLYVKEYYESEGFDVAHFSSKVFGLLRLELDEENPFYDSIMVNECHLALEAAVNYVNEKKKSNLVFRKLIKANYVDGARFYATFDAEDGDDTRTYQALLVRHYFTGKVTIYKFRPKPDAPPEYQD